jgi:hypothetical protein
MVWWTIIYPALVDLLCLERDNRTSSCRVSCSVDLSSYLRDRDYVVAGGRRWWAYRAWIWFKAEDAALDGGDLPLESRKTLLTAMCPWRSAACSYSTRWLRQLHLPPAVREREQHFVLLEIVHEADRLAAKAAKDLSDLLARLSAVVAAA